MALKNFLENEKLYKIIAYYYYLYIVLDACFSYLPYSYIFWMFDMLNFFWLNINPMPAYIALMRCNLKFYIHSYIFSTYLFLFVLNVSFVERKFLIPYSIKTRIQNIHLSWVLNLPVPNCFTSEESFFLDILLDW